MKPMTRPAALLAALTVFAGCGKTGTVDLSDDNNYYFLADITAASQQVGAREDATVDWCALTTDLQDRAVDPAADVDIARMIRFTLTQDEVIEGINYDNLRQSDVSGNADYENPGSDCSAPLSDFFFLGSAFPVEDELVETTDAYLLSLITLTEEGGEDYRTFTFIEPVEGNTNHEVYLEDSTATLAYDVDISSSAPLVFEDNDTIIDWAGLTGDAADQSITLSNIDTLMLAQYDTLTLADLEADFLKIEDVADRIFYANVEGRGDFDLAELTDENGAAFDGFDSGTWLLALRCGTCISPAPLFLGYVTP
jgi:hypothetical protein